MDYSLDYNRDFINEDKVISRECKIPLLRGRCCSDSEELQHLKGLRWQVHDNRCLKVVVNILDVRTIQLKKGDWESKSKSYSFVGVGKSRKKSKISFVTKLANSLLKTQGVRKTV